MAFRFRLQKVLDYRQKLVDTKSRAVGDAARKVAGIQGELDRNAARQQQLLQHAGPTGAEVDLNGLQQRRWWLDHLDRRRQSLDRDLAAAVEELERRRSDLTEAWRDLEVLKKLKLRQKEDWLYEQLRRENQDLDEVGQIRADRRQREKLASRTAQPAEPPGQREGCGVAP